MLTRYYHHLGLIDINNIAKYVFSNVVKSYAR